MDLHAAPPMTLARVTARHQWLLPVALITFCLLTVGAVFNALPWDKPITAWMVDSRTPWLDAVVRRVSFLGSTKVVLTVAGLAALASVRRCPRLALAIVVIALARPATEFVLKEIISRDRPSGDRMVNGTGYSFPSGHPLATAASWCLLPLVAALYTRRRIVWWALAISVWTLAFLIAISRVWLGVHWTSDVVAAMVLAVLGVSQAERFIHATHGTSCGDSSAVGDAHDVDRDVVDRPVLEAAP
jgi:undecaprenyl-diphosphatase